MKKICIYDLNNDGHHWFYNTNVMKALQNQYEIHYLTSGISNNKKRYIYDNKYLLKVFKFKTNSKLKRYFYEIKNIIKAILYCKKNKIFDIYIMNLDSNIIWLYFLRKIFKCKDIKFYCIEHWFPNNKYKKNILIKLIKNIVLIVHTDDINKKIKYFTNNDLDNISLIKYPVMKARNIDKKICSKFLNIKTNNKILLYFGGTRHDKGLDILLKSLEFINNDIFLLIAGKEETFKKKFILEEMKKNPNIEYKLDLKFIDDKDIEYYFNISDFIVIPYRRYFNGESGVFSEAINYGKPVIAPDIIHFPNVIDKYGNGAIFEVENEKDLAMKIDYVSNNLDELTVRSKIYSKIFQEEHSIENFKNSYRKLMR